MRAAAEAVPTAEFRIDPNQAWTFPDCVRFAEACRGMNIEYLEQPVRVQSLAEAARLRQRIAIPLALNDDCYGPWTLDAIVRHGAADVAIVDLEPLAASPAWSAPRISPRPPTSRWRTTAVSTSASRPPPWRR